MDFLAQLSYVEGVAVVTSFLCVWFYTRQNVWSWPLAIVSAVLYIFVFFQARFYAQMVLQGVYIIISIYGWYQWLYGGAQQGALKVSRVTRTTALVLAGIVVVGTGVVAYVLATYTTHAAIPFWDALTTVMSLTAQWMLAKKILENWLYWIVIDAVSIFLYFDRGLYPTVGLFIIYTVIAIFGFLAWRKSYRAQIPCPSNA